jgi:type VI secretion system protein ImpE
MPTAKEHLDKGDLRAAIDAQTQEVKESPTDSQRRIFLFELLSFAGEWERAEKQLDAIAQPETGQQQAIQAQLALQVYRNNLAAEKSRAKVFAEGERPGFLRPVPAYVEKLVAALAKIRGKAFAEARALLDEAELERPALAGTLDGTPFDDFRDYNDIVASVLELYVNGRYVWLPLEQIRKIDVHPPKKLRDLIWAPAHVEADDGTVGDVFIPALYAGSDKNDDDLVKLGRMTDWIQLPEEVVLGAGQRTFLAGEDEKGLFETHVIELSPVPAETGEPS